MKRPKIKVEERKTLGKKVKKLRREHILPANIYGKDVKSLAVQLPYKEFEKLFKEVGETGLIDIEVDGKVRPSLIHNVQYDYLKQVLVHADFYQVNLKEKVKTMVPIKIVGEAKAVADKLGLLLQPLSEVEVEALPEDLPENIEVNVQKLAQVEEQITVGEIKAPTGVTILTDASQVVAKVEELVSKEAQAQQAQEAAAAEAAKAEAAPAGEASKAEETPKVEEKPTPEAPKEQPKP